MTPEAIARQKIDAMLLACGWVVQDYAGVDLSAGVGVALREVPLTGGRCDYLLIVGRVRRAWVKANVLFFDRKPAQEKPWTSKLWIYDLRTNVHFTLKEKTLQRSDLDGFVECYNSANRHERKESERSKAFAYGELVKRDKANLDIFWLKDDALEDSANLPAPGIIAREIVDDLEAALEQFSAIAEDLKK